jgi:hypothetical protein
MTNYAHFLQALDKKRQAVIFIVEGFGFTVNRIDWENLESGLTKRDPDLMERLSALNDRFAKLQDLTGGLMKHWMLANGLTADDFRLVISTMEKHRLIDSADVWRAIRLMRNDAAHEYDIDVVFQQNYFNEVHRLGLLMCEWANRVIEWTGKEV